MRLTNNFTLSEFNCKDGSKVPEKYMGNLQELADNLQVLRNFIEKPIMINSGYRSPNYNDVVLPSRGIKTAKNSFHKKAMASDIKVKGMTPKEVKEAIEFLILGGKMKQGGLKAYNTFVHYDVRGYKARW